LVKSRKFTVWGEKTISPMAGGICSDGDWTAFLPPESLYQLSEPVDISSEITPFIESRSTRGIGEPYNRNEGVSQTQ
jgi:hypothetical protein